MRKFTEHIKRVSNDVHLSDSERVRMKNVIEGYMRFHPLPEPVTRYTITRDWVMYLHRPLAAALVLVLVTGSSFSYAAEAALPGDALYFLKTKVNEPVKVALSRTVEARAETQIALAERRIAEATELAAEDRLDDATQDSLAVAFEIYAASAQVSVEEIDREDSSAAAQLSSSFETRIRAREEILNQIRSRTISDDSSNNRIAQSIELAGNAVAAARSRSEEKLAVSGSVGGAFEATIAADVPAARMAKVAPVSVPETATLSMVAEEPTVAMDSVVTENVTPAPAQHAATSSESVDRKAAENMKKAAERKLKSVEKQARKSERAQDDLEAAEELLDEGREHFKSDDIVGAFHAFRMSLETSERVSVFLDSASVLKKAEVWQKKKESSGNSDSSKKKDRDEDEREDD